VSEPARGSGASGRLSVWLAAGWCAPEDQNMACLRGLSPDGGLSLQPPPAKTGRSVGAVPYPRSDLSSRAGWRPRLARGWARAAGPGGGEAVAGDRGAASTGACETSGRPCGPTFPVPGDHAPQYLCPPASAPPGHALSEARPRATLSLALSEPHVGGTRCGLRRVPSAPAGRRPRLFPRPKWGGV
jgi:hypothetical protein